MPACRRFDLHPAARQLAVWLLLVALTVQGCAAVMVRVLGPTHSHSSNSAQGLAPASTAFTSSLLTEFLAWRAARQEFLRTHGLFKTKPAEPVGHSHDGWQRHHHDADDATVLSLDGSAAHVDAAGDSGHQGQAGALSLPWAPAVEHLLFRADSSPAAWALAAPVRWASAWTRLLERPPRA